MSSRSPLSSAAGDEDTAVVGEGDCVVDTTREEATAGIVVIADDDSG